MESRTYPVSAYVRNRGGGGRVIRPWRFLVTSTLIVLGCSLSREGCPHHRPCPFKVERLVLLFMVLKTLVYIQNPFLTRPRAVPEGLWVAHKVVRNCIILDLLIPNPPGYRN